MKKCLFILVLFPLASIAQTGKSKTRQQQGKVQTNETVVAKLQKGYLISGTMKGFPDGTPVALLNGNNGVPEATGKVMGEKFSLSGSVEYPDFKLLAFNNQAPYITLFLDNSAIKVTGTSTALEAADVKGSPSHNEFIVFNNIIKPYQELFSAAGSTDTVAKNAASALLKAYIKKYPKSYIAPLAIYRNYQANGNGDMMEELFSNVAPNVKDGPIGKFITQQITEFKKNPIGKPLADFSQADSTGKPISLSSLKGKYVLIDFWASWCGPCRQENPNVVATYNKYKNRNYTVLGVSFDKTKAPWLDAIRADGLTWTHVSDLQGWNNSVGQQFQIYSIPQNFLVDPNGILIAKNLRGAALESKLASLFGN